MKDCIRKLAPKYMKMFECPTKQLINSFECPLPYTVLDIKGCLQFILFKKSFAQIYFTFKLILL